MKKKKAKHKLRLAKQTIRRLGADQLGIAIGAGGTNTTYFPTLIIPNPNPNPTTSLTC